MGVPSLFRWLARKYPHTIYQASASEYVDNLYLDLNGVIHPCCHPVNKAAPSTEAGMFCEVFKHIDHLVSITSPRHVLYIAVDGVAPRAKMNQQRERRFKAAMERGKENGEPAPPPSDPLEEDIADTEKSDPIIEKDLKSLGFDSNCITPGTPFMMRLHSSLRDYIEDRLASNPLWADLSVVYSGCDVPGEGEHKIYDFIRRHRGARGTETRHVICGLDADLIFLSLATHERHFRVLREDVFWLEKEERSVCSVCNAKGHTPGNCVAPEFPPHIYLDISTLRNYLQSEFVRAMDCGGNFERLLDDWIFICFFVGNDFLPSVPCLDIRVNAIESLTGIYLSTFAQRRVYLTEASKINYKELSNFLFELARIEKGLLYAKHMNYLRMVQRRNESPREEDAAIRLYEDAGRERYYKEKLQARTSDEINEVSLAYIEGLSWILKYYHEGCPSWSWYYPHHFAPYAADLSLISSPDVRFSLGKPRRPLEQVMSVLPPNSRESVPVELHSIFSEQAAYYPAEVKIDLFGKVQAWQGVALLPFIDDAVLTSCVREKVHSLPLEDVYRNIEGSDLVFFSEKNRNYKAAESLYADFRVHMDIDDEYCGGRIAPHPYCRLPGERGEVREEGKQYVIGSICAAYSPVRK